VYENESIPDGDAPLGDATISRRVAMQRAAVAGGALAFAVPVVQRLGQMSAGAASPVPPPPPPPPPPSFHGISYVAFVFTCADGKTSRLKWDEDENDYDSGSALPSCESITPSDWLTAEVYPTPDDVSLEKTNVGGELFQLVVTLPDGCTAEAGDAVVKGAQQCQVGIISGGGSIITFNGLPK
jgi:hypothetical protein